MADLYLDGDWCEAVAGGHREIRCPADGTLVATVSEGTRADTEIAIAQSSGVVSLSCRSTIALVPTGLADKPAKNCSKI